MPKHRRKSVHLQKCKRAKAVTIVGQFRKRPSDVADANHMETHTVGSNPFIFTTLCAPDAEQFQFICQSCIKVRFAEYPELRQHEEWCARVRNSEGFVCLLCGRHYRNLGTLRRHTLEYHSVPVSSEMILENPFQFSTTVAMDSASYPHVCQSCQLVCFNSLADLRRHEDWCGQAAPSADGSRCDKCGRHFRTADLLLRHATAGDCTATSNATGATDVENCNAGTASESSICDAQQKSVARMTTYSVCPLCDVPFMSQYEQQVHFINIHNLTNSELKVKRPVPKRPRLGRVGDEVTCLDCDRTFSSRLLLSRHKQICMKEKKYTKVLIPVTDSRSRQSIKKKCSSVEDGYTSWKGDANYKTTNSGFSAGTAAKCKIRNNVGVTKLSVGGTSRAKKLQVSSRLLMNTAKVRNLIRCGSGKKLLMKSDGELFLVGSKTTVTDLLKGSVKMGSSSVKSSYKQGCSEKMSDATSIAFYMDSMPTTSDTGDSIINEKKLIRSLELQRDKCTNDEDLKSISESVELLCTEHSSEEGFRDNNSKVNDSVGVIRQTRQRASRSLETGSGLVSEPKTNHDVGKQRTLKRKWSLKEDITDVDSSLHGYEVRNHNEKKESAVQNTKSRKSVGTAAKYQSVLQTVDQPTADPSGEIKNTRVAGGPQTLVEALELFPSSTQSTDPGTVPVRGRTRSGTRACVAAADTAATKRR